MRNIKLPIQTHYTIGNRKNRIEWLSRPIYICNGATHTAALLAVIHVFWRPICSAVTSVNLSGAGSGGSALLEKSDISFCEKFVSSAEAFDQDPKTTTAVSTVLRGATLTVNSERWMEFLNDRAVGNVDFRLEITSVIKFDIYTWHSRRHKIRANCDVAVGQDG
ncbi:hypothetical protein Nepgr_007189 [Nepenthes gracilis]|uniref:Uncharacterized protein n=1 Tax=Nepenthes gracilis TaxID=150966 RepID=A0AAD3S6Q5_NEPGR|nr:hypothetical protein Nepgr_007189 [Nepenthes gracilis]